jgi:molybdopterin converting factor subunit 1
MRVRVLYFGVLREMLGRSDEAMDLNEGATVGELVRVLRGRASNESMADDRLWSSLAVAVNREYVAAETVLRGGDEVALLPPVSGGLLCAGLEPSFGAERTAKGELRSQRLLSKGGWNEG